MENSKKTSNAINDVLDQFPTVKIMSKNGDFRLFDENGKEIPCVSDISFEIGNGQEGRMPVGASLVNITTKAKFEFVSWEDYG